MRKIYFSQNKSIRMKHMHLSINPFEKLKKDRKNHLSQKIGIQNDRLVKKLILLTT